MIKNGRIYSITVTKEAALSNLMITSSTTAEIARVCGHYAFQDRSIPLESPHENLY